MAEIAQERREKYWSEIDAYERIARLRIVLKQLQVTVSSLESKVYDLEHHSHDTAGRAVSPLGNALLEPRPPDGDDQYF